MSRIHSNNFETTLTSSISNSDTTITLASATGFPSIGAGVTCNLTLVNGANIEIVTATARSGNNVTVTRAQEGTVALSFPGGTTVGLYPTADSVDRKADGASSSTDNTLARYDGTSGKILQSSGIVVDDSNNVTGAATITTATITGTTKLVVGGTTTAAGYVEFLEDSDNGNNKITLTAPASISSDKTITFPDTTGTIALSSQLPNSFNTISVSGQSDVVADSTTDTLTLVAGSNVTITTNAGSDSITIAASGGGGGGATLTAFKVTLSGDQGISSGSPERVDWDSEVFDYGTQFSSGTFTPTAEGVYHLTAHIEWASPGGTARLWVWIYKNGNPVAQMDRTVYESNVQQLEVSGDFYANGSGDYFEVFVQHAAGGTKNVNLGEAHSYFCGHLVYEV